MTRLHINMMLGAAIGMIAVAIALTFAMNSGQADALAPEVAALPECDPATMGDADPPCRLIEDGKTLIYWDGIKSRPGPAPTPEPIPYATQSIHPAILATAEAQGITLSLDDYEEVYPGVVHSHFPIECEELPFCSEMYMHRFDGLAEKFYGWPNVQRHGINYVEVNGDLYLDDLSQLTEPTRVPPTPTAVGD